MNLSDLFNFMNNKTPLEKFIPRSKQSFAFGILIALIVLGATIFSGLYIMRDLVTEQIAQRDAEALYATTLLEQIDPAPEDGIEFRSGFDAAIRSSRLRGVLGIRFYDKTGEFTDSFPATVLPLPLEKDTLKSTQRFIPSSQFINKCALSSVFIYLPQFSYGDFKEVPILLVTVPLHERDTRTLAGAAQFIIEGNNIQQEYAQLDERLIQIGITSFIISTSLLLIMLLPAFRHQQKLNRQLTQYSEQLEQANNELALTARVSALGAVSAHLMHGLKNPLASLSQFVAHNKQDRSEIEPEEWHDALLASRRMQCMVEHTLEVLSDAKGEPTYELTVNELGDDILSRIEAIATANQIQTSFNAEGNCKLSSRTANLASLIMINILENGIQATPPGGLVSLSVSRRDEQLHFLMTDEGPGLSDSMINQLFLPAHSTHEGGSGIGLAISKQIADYLGAELSLEKTSKSGSSFLLKLPIAACLNPPK